MNAAGRMGASPPRPARLLTRRPGGRAAINGGQAASVCLDVGRNLVRRGP